MAQDLDEWIAEAVERAPPEKRHRVYLAWDKMDAGEKPLMNEILAPIIIEKMMDEHPDGKIRITDGTPEPGWSMKKGDDCVKEEYKW